MKNTIRTLTAFSVLITTFGLISCGDKKDAEKSTNTSGSKTTLDSIVTLESAGTASAQSIIEVRKSPEIGKKIVMRGKVMGRKDPFIEGRAMLLIGDDNVLTSCDIHSCESCPTPWDVCCEDAEDIKRSTATVQVLDKDGKLLRQGLKGIKGLKELSQIVVTGTIAEGTNANNLLVNATSIYVKP